MSAVKEISGDHAPLAFQLHLEQTQRSLFAATHNQVVAVSGNHFTRRGRRVSIFPRHGLPNDQPVRFPMGVCIGPGLKASNAALNRNRIRVPIDETVRFNQQWCKGRFARAG